MRQGFFICFLVICTIFRRLFLSPPRSASFASSSGGIARVFAGLLVEPLAIEEQIGEARGTHNQDDADQRGKHPRKPGEPRRGKGGENEAEAGGDAPAPHRSAHREPQPRAGDRRKGIRRAVLPDAFPAVEHSVDAASGGKGSHGEAHPEEQKVNSVQWRGSRLLHGHKSTFVARRSSMAA